MKLVALREIVFYLGLGALFTHELDAVMNAEWRLLPWIRQLPGDEAAQVYVLFHVPLYALVVALVASRNERLRDVSRLALAGFLIAHAGLHLWFSDARGPRFDSPLSQSLILAAAALGAIYLVLSLRIVRRR